LVAWLVDLQFQQTCIINCMVLKLINMFALFAFKASLHERPYVLITFPSTLQALMLKNIPIFLSAFFLYILILFICAVLIPVT